MTLTLIPLLLAAAVLLLAYAARSLINPYLTLFFVPVGTSLGYLFRLFGDTALVSFSLFQIFLILTFVAFFLNRIINRDLQIRLPGLELEFLLFFTLISFSLIYSPNRVAGALFEARLLVLVLMIYLIINVIRHPRQIAYMIYAVAAACMILGVFSIREAILNPQTVLVSYLSMGTKLARGTTVFTEHDPNKFAANFFLPIFFAVSVVMVRRQKHLTRIIWSIIFAVLLGSVISTFSRSAWISIIIAVMLLTFLFKQYKIILYLGLAALAALIFIPFVQLVVVNVLRRFVDIFAGASDASSSVRIELGKGALEMIFDTNLLGVGFMGFPEMLPKYVSTQKTMGIVEPHNLFYTVFAELGLLGLLLFGWILWKTGKTALANFRKSTSSIEQAVSATLIATFVAQLIFFQFYVDGLMDNNLWFNVGLIYSMHCYFSDR